MTNKKIFLDSSVLITALLSSQGGSFYVLTNYKDAHKFFINEYVLTETRDVLRRKFPKRQELDRDLFLLIGLIEIHVLANLPIAIIKPLYEIIEQTDAPILASATNECDILLTLDNDFLAKKVKTYARQKNTIIITPGEFIQRSER